MIAGLDGRASFIGDTVEKIQTPEHAMHVRGLLGHGLDHAVQPMLRRCILTRALVDGLALRVGVAAAGHLVGREPHRFGGDLGFGQDETHRRDLARDDVVDAIDFAKAA